jgi:hypothetical protein
MWECAFFQLFSEQTASRAATGDLFAKPIAEMQLVRLAIHPLP